MKGFTVSALVQIQEQSFSLKKTHRPKPSSISAGALFFLISEPQASFACDPIVVIEQQMKSLRHPPASQIAVWAFACQHFASIPQLP